jgi:hypothetical protein
MSLHLEVMLISASQPTCRAKVLSDAEPKSIAVKTSLFNGLLLIESSQQNRPSGGSVNLNFYSCQSLSESVRSRRLRCMRCPGKSRPWTGQRSKYHQSAFPECLTRFHGNGSTLGFGSQHVLNTALPSVPSVNS